MKCTNNPTAPVRCLVMLGTDFTAPGGITAVVRAYRDGGLFEQWPVLFLATYKLDSTSDKLRAAAAALVQFGKLLLRREVACVHAHVAARGSFWRKSLFLVLGHIGGARTIFHLHDGSFPAWYDARSSWVRFIVRRVLCRMDRVIVLSTVMESWVNGIEPAATTVVIGNPVDLPPEPAARFPGKLLFLGRLWREKGVYDLLDALALLNQAGLHFELVCAGDGDLDGVRQKARELGIGDMVTLPGWVEGEAKAALLQSTSVFVLPSYFEGLPIGVLEAMAHGIPVVATDVGGIPDAIGSQAGILVKPGDINALAAAMTTLLSNRALQTQMGAAGRRRIAAEFETSKVLEKIGAMYTGLGMHPTMHRGQNNTRQKA
jgi:glycosyltransferase involved in cell wall biosynthesis